MKQQNKWDGIFQISNQDQLSWTDILGFDRLENIIANVSQCL